MNILRLHHTKLIPINFAISCRFKAYQSQGEWRSKVKNLRRRISIEEDTTKKKLTLETSQKVVALAISTNALMFSGKLYGAIVSGSASMYAESLHSFADMMNECLLMIGIMRSLRSPTGDHPYGYITEKYAWALGFSSD